MYVEHVAQHESSYLIGVLTSSVLLIRPYLSVWASLGMCLPQAILKLLMVKLSVQTGSLRTNCVTFFLLI